MGEGEFNQELPEVLAGQREGGLLCKVTSGLSQGGSLDKLDTVEGFLRWDVVRKMTFKVSGDVEVLGVSELGNSLALE